MSKHLSELLGAEEPLFSIALQQLERSSGNPGEDVRLSAEIVGKVHQKISELGLDPKDTTGRELYQSLLEMVKLHDSFLASRIGAKDPSDVQDILPRIKTFIDKLGIQKNAWVMRPSVAKRLLKANPPKNLMKQLGYRSIDSMLKREHVAELYGALRYTEPQEWVEGFMKNYKHLNPNDFENKPIEIFLLDDKKWGRLAGPYVQTRRHNITHLKELGTVLILPLPIQRFTGLTIMVLPLLVHYINEIRTYSAFFKLQQMHDNFGEIVSDTLSNDPGKHASMAGHDIHWKIIHRYYGSRNPKLHPEIFEPHVQPEDLAWRKAEEVLYRIEPALHFWHDMDYVGHTMPGGPVSLNLVDNAVNYVNGLSYSRKVSYHFRESLWNEILIRYLGQRTLEQQVLKQLDKDILMPEFNELISDVIPERSFLV